MSVYWIAFVFVFGATVSTTVAFADEAQQPGVLAQNEVSTSLTDKVWDAVRDHAYVNYFAIYHGAPLNRFTSPYMADSKGALSSRAINFDSDLTVAYLFSKDIGAGLDLPFILSPVLGQGATLGNVGLKPFATTRLLGNLTLYGNVILQAPTGEFDSKRGMDVGIKSTPYVRYRFQGSRWAVGSWSEVKSYIGVTSGNAFKLWAEPYVSYQVLPTLALNLGYEIESDHIVHRSGFEVTETDWQPGFVWMITHKILINPYVQIYSTNSYSTDRTALGAVISATL
jgi:hypothetical protein